LRLYIEDLFQENQQQSDTYAKDYDKRYKDMCSQFNLPHAKESVSVNRTQAPEKAAFNSQQYSENAEHNFQSTTSCYYSFDLY